MILNCGLEKKTKTKTTLYFIVIVIVFVFAIGRGWLGFATQYLDQCTEKINLENQISEMEYFLAQMATREDDLIAEEIETLTAQLVGRNEEEEVVEDLLNVMQMLEGQVESVEESNRKKCEHFQTSEELSYRVVYLATEEGNQKFIRGLMGRKDIEVDNFSSYKIDETTFQTTLVLTFHYV